MNDARITTPLGAVPPASPTSPARPAASPPVDTGFQALLERLQRFTPPAAEATPVATPDELQAAVRAADSSFTTAMDLRQQLEAAFRRHAGRP